MKENNFSVSSKSSPNFEKIEKSEENEENFDEIIEKKIAEIENYAQMAEKPSRFEHSKRTAKMCQTLAIRYGLNAKKAFLAGIAHDICKECADAILFTLASGDNLPIGTLERKKMALLHGRAAAQMLKVFFDVQDEEIIEAVQNHTFGKKGMSDFAKILFIADKIEPGREQITEEKLKSYEKLSLNELAFLIVQENIDYLHSKGKKVSDFTFEFYEHLKFLLKEEKRG